MRTSSLFLAIAAIGGCLREPHGHQPPDASPQPPWPPAGVVVERARVADLDRDGFDDLVIASSGTTAPGVYVLMGSTAGVGATYRVQLSTAPTYDVDVADLDGDTNLEIAALSSPTEGHEDLSLFHANGPASWDAPWRQSLQSPPATVAGFPFNYRNWQVRMTALAGGHAAIALTLGKQPDYGVGLLQLSSVSKDGFETAAATLLAVPEFYYPTSIFFVAGGSASSVDLLVASYANVTRFPGVGTTGDPALDFQNHALAFAGCDLGHPAIVGGTDTWSAVVDTHPTLTRLGFDFTQPSVAAMLCATLDDGRDMDLAILGNPTPTEPDTIRSDTGTTVIVQPNLTVAADNMSLSTAEASRARTLPAGQTASALVSGDVDHDGVNELIAVSRDGAINCYRLGPTALEDCPWQPK